ncbi:fatty acyl-AMP ligase [Kitasatospora sp. NPDC006697]|uniref:fatty acyl-AMP ligase n=1 Tax=Kitasatospora sp. NPDC006697 TaxID=3364020 RepID=UPI0036C2FCE1
MTFDLAVHQNVGDAFAERVAAHPERAALTLYRGSAAPGHDTVDYAELARRAGLRAAWLAERLPLGERVLLVLPTGAEFVEYYLGCLLAGLVAVPAPVPGGGASATDRVAAIVEDCRPALAIAPAGGGAELAEQFRGHGLADLAVVEAAEAGPGTAPAGFADGRRPDRDTVAVVQYSSGSTGTPRGVVLTHGSVLANTRSMNTHGKLGPEDTFGSWLPLHHDMGLFVLLTAGLLFGSRVVLMSPADFVRRPVEWLRMLAKFGCTVTAGPNFAFDLCTRLVPDAKLVGLDLTGVRYILNGSEPIHLPTMRAFNERFAAYGLSSRAVSPCYGLAEATAYVSASRPAGDPLVFLADQAALQHAERPELLPVPAGAQGAAAVGKEVVGCGTLGDMELRIVDRQTRRELADGRIGEIWLRGGNLGTGYWNRPELNAELFDARLADSADDRPWLRTGDLGAVLDGELYITGRIKEILVVRGRNFFPNDVEQEARASHEALQGFLGAAFGVTAPDERMVLVHEVNPVTPQDELPAVASTVARRLTTALGVPVRNVVLVRRGSVRRTTSGKIQRSAMRERFLSGELVALHAELEPEVQLISAGGAG